MKCLFAGLLLLYSHVVYGGSPCADTTYDVLHNQSLLPDAHRRQTFAVRENDSTNYSLQLALDKDGRPLYYYRNIFTPVCYTGECKPVFINFYWDLLGNYIRYDLPAGEALTKLDHKVFKPADYEKLQEILAKPDCLLAELKITDLIVPGTEKLADSVDARTGATLKTIKNEVIPGAVYTCYTLWHMAHGNVVEEINRITETYNSKQLLHRFLSSGNPDYQYWALGKVMDKKGMITPGFETAIRNIVNSKHIFIARYILQQVDAGFYTGKKAQHWLWDTFTRAPYPAQLTILRRLKNVPLQGELVRRLADTLANANGEQANLLLALLKAAPENNYDKKKLHDYEIQQHQ